MRCQLQFRLKDRPDIWLPCGKCADCRQRRASGWSFRLMKEYERSTSAYFVTFSYDNESVPRSKKGVRTLNKRDFQLYMKRLRFVHGKGLKYYVCGEYGPKTLRPHYHALMFNVDLAVLLDDKLLAKKALLYPQYYLDGKFHFNEPFWKNGHITIGLITQASVAYCLKYISKPHRVPQWEGDDRQPEFSLMSKGLGANYLTEARKLYHKADLNNRLYVNVGDGKKAALPRYYKNKIYDPVEREQVGLYFQKMAIDEMAEMSREQIDEKMTKWSENMRNIEEREKRGKKDLTNYSI